MEQLKIAKPNAHPARMIFKINDIPLTEVSKALNLNYSYVCSMLAGSRHVPSHIDLKLHELAERVENKFGKNTPNEQASINDKDQLE
ncbi:MAG: hypothetical protein P8X68_05190 [Desulfobacterales bacterium]|jgi:hypothetical protein